MDPLSKFSPLSSAECTKAREEATALFNTARTKRETQGSHGVEALKTYHEVVSQSFDEMLKQYEEEKDLSRCTKLLEEKEASLKPLVSQVFQPLGVFITPVGPPPPEKATSIDQIHQIIRALQQDHQVAVQGLYAKLNGFSKEIDDKFSALFSSINHFNKDVKERLAYYHKSCEDFDRASSSIHEELLPRLQLIQSTAEKMSGIVRETLSPLMESQQQFTERALKSLEARKADGEVCDLYGALIKTADNVKWGGFDAFVKVCLQTFQSMNQQVSASVVKLVDCHLSSPHIVLDDLGLGPILTTQPEPLLLRENYESSYHPPKPHPASLLNMLGFQTDQDLVLSKVDELSNRLNDPI